MTDDHVDIDPQQVANGLGVWEAASDTLNSQWSELTGQIDKLIGADPWGADQAGNNFRNSFVVDGKAGALTASGKKLVTEIKKVGQNARKSVEASLASDKQQASEVGKVDVPSAFGGNGGGSGSGGGGAGVSSGGGSASGGSAGMVMTGGQAAGGASGDYMAPKLGEGESYVQGPGTKAAGDYRSEMVVEGQGSFVDGPGDSTIQDGGEAVYTYQDSPRPAFEARPVLPEDPTSGIHESVIAAPMSHDGAAHFGTQGGSDGAGNAQHGSAGHASGGQGNASQGNGGQGNGGQGDAGHASGGASGGHASGGAAQSLPSDPGAQPVSQDSAPVAAPTTDGGGGGSASAGSGGGGGGGGSASAGGGGGGSADPIAHSADPGQSHDGIAERIHEPQDAHDQVAAHIPDGPAEQLPDGVSQHLEAGPDVASMQGEGSVDDGVQLTGVEGEKYLADLQGADGASAQTGANQAAPVIEGNQESADDGQWRTDGDSQTGWKAPR